MPYTIIDEAGTALWRGETISSGQAWIAGQFGVEFRKVDDWSTEPRHADSLGAYLKNGWFFEIVHEPAQPPPHPPAGEPSF
jgi:hypothetical protein